ncbi:MAG TPA: ACT domain-containing protein [Candidatus Merdivicinus faecavium]|nr:ACT domain-containing protein [Candidatus Merdivicinus faecavium]
MSEKPRFLIVSADVLPEVILKVLEAKRLLSKAQAKNSSEACRMVGISRSAYYKYKDNVQLYEERDNSQLGTLYLKLSDEPGVLSRVLKKLYDNGANILTVNQNIPVDAVAIVTISIRVNRDEVSMEEILRNLSEIDGVVSVKRI